MCKVGRRRYRFCSKEKKIHLTVLRAEKKIKIFREKYQWRLGIKAT